VPNFLVSSLTFSVLLQRLSPFVFDKIPLLLKNQKGQ